jgi:NADH:ubiquinone oxidoreductase subunit C
MEILNIIKKNLGEKIEDIKIVNPRRVYIQVPPDYIRSAADFLFNQMKFRFATASGIDEKDFMEILYHFSLDKQGVFVSLRVKLDFSKPEVDTITDIITGAKWIEREMHELLGIDFKGNNDLRSLLLSESYKGKKFPLRKND